MWLWGFVEWGGKVFLLGIVLWGGFWTWVVIMVDGMEDNGMFWEIIGFVEVVMDVALLLLGSKLGSI